ARSTDTRRTRCSDPSPTLFIRCNGLRDRWVNGLASARLRSCNRYTLSRRDTCIRCKPTHPSPSACQFRLLLNGLAASALRRMFCSDEGACVRAPKDALTRTLPCDTRRTRCSADPGFSVHQVQRDPSMMLVSAHLQPSYP